MIRGISFLVLLIIAATGPWWLLVALGVAYALVYAGLELVFVAVFVDALFMSSNVLVPYYTVASIGLLLCIEYIKPHLRLYNQPS